MDQTYTYNVSQTLNDKVDTDRLSIEVHDSSITIALNFIDVANGIISLVFKAELSDDEELTLDGIIAAHSGEPVLPAIPIMKSEVLTEHIKFVESGDVTQGMYAAESLIIDVSVGQSEKISDFTWPFDIALMSGTLGVTEDMIGDNIHIHVGPNTLIGALIAPLNVGDTSMYVSPTVLQNIKKGFFIGMWGGQGNDGNEISQVIDIDSPNNALTIHPSDVSANPGSYVAMCAKIIPELYLHSIDKVEIGKQITTRQRIPAKVPVRVIYHNINEVAKKISFFVEYLY